MSPPAPGAPSQRSSAAPPPSRAVSRQGHGGCSAVSKQNDVCWSHTIAVERKGLGMSKEGKARMRAELELSLSLCQDWEMAISDPVFLALAAFNVSDPHGHLFGGVPPTLPSLGRIALAKRDVVAAGERG